MGNEMHFDVFIKRLVNTCLLTDKCDKQVTHLAAAAAMAAEWTGSSPTAVTRLCDNDFLLQPA